MNEIIQKDDYNSFPWKLQKNKSFMLKSLSNSLSIKFFIKVSLNLKLNLATPYLMPTLVLPALLTGWYQSDGNKKTLRDQLAISELNS